MTHVTANKSTSSFRIKICELINISQSLRKLGPQRQNLLYGNIREFTGYIASYVLTDRHTYIHSIYI